MKILYVTTIGITMRFFESFVRKLLNEGHTVDIATNEAESKVPECYRDWGCRVHVIPTSRFPFSKGNITAIKQIHEIVKINKYDLVHCHTPVAAMCTRLACCRLRKQGIRVFYTSHGFHFYKGAPLKNWLLYYPVEKLCSYWTDILITINQEDYSLAQKKMKAKRIEYVPGVGIDLEKFGGITVDKEKKRRELEIPEDATLLLSVGELNKNKNHETVIRAIADLDVYYIIAGHGELLEHLQCLIDELKLTDRVKLLGYRNDISELCKVADAFVFPSYREGLSVSVMEAMASGLPVVCSRIRGNTDLIDENGGVLFDPHSVEQCRKAVRRMLNCEKKEMGDYNKGVVRKFGYQNVSNIIRGFYF